MNMFVDLSDAHKFLYKCIKAHILQIYTLIPIEHGFEAGFCEFI